MNVPRGLLFLYGLLDIANGVEGFVSHQSVPWLVWNGTFGAIILTGLALPSRRRVLGYSMCAAIAALDTFYFGRKLIRDHEVWPACVIACAAACGLACAIVEIAHRDR